MTLTAALALPFCLLLGLALGWFARGRMLKGQGEDIAELRRALDAERESLGRSEAERSGLLAERQARTEAFEAQIRQLQEAREQLSAQFAEIGGKLLEQAQRQFLERADQRFHQAGEKSEAQLKALLNPV